MYSVGVLEHSFQYYAFGSVPSIRVKIQFSLVNATNSSVENSLGFGLVPVFTPSSILRNEHMSSHGRHPGVRAPMWFGG